MNGDAVASMDHVELVAPMRSRGLAAATTFDRVDHASRPVANVCSFPASRLDPMPPSRKSELG